VQAGQSLQKYSEVIAVALTNAIRSVSDAVLASCGATTSASNAAAAGAAAAGNMAAALSRQQQQQRSAGAVLASEVTQEGLAAAALVDVMLQVCRCNMTVTSSLVFCHVIIQGSCQDQ